MRLDFAEIVAELIQPIAWGGDSVGGQDGVVDLPGSPTADRRAAVEQDLHEPDHACVVNLDAGKPGSSYRDRQRQTLQERNSMWTFRHCAWNVAKRSVIARNFSRTAAMCSRPFFKRKSARLLEQISFRRKVESFSYCLRKACLK